MREYHRQKKSGAFQIEQNRPISRLKQERKKQGMGQSELAQRLGVSVVMISRWENGRAIPHPYTQRELSNIFGVDCTYLFPKSSTRSYIPKMYPDPPQLSRLRQVRIQHGYSQGTLAQAVETTRSAIHRWEYELSLPNSYHLTLLCQLFQLPPEELFPALASLETDEAQDFNITKPTLFSWKESGGAPALSYEEKEHQPFIQEVPASVPHVSWSAHFLLDY